MSLTLYAHPFSSYCWKVLIAFWEKDLPFTYRNLEEPGAGEAMAERWPIGKMPVLVDGEQTVAASSIIIEHLDLHHAGPRLIPVDAEAALRVRFLDRFFDQYVMTPMQQSVSEKLRRGDRLEDTLADSGQALNKAYGWLEQELRDRVWAAGDNFRLADCAAAPSLFYADWVHPIAPAFTRVWEYRERLLSRRSVKRAVEEARPYRAYFPLRAPDRDYSRQRPSITAPIGSPEPTNRFGKNPPLPRTADTRSFVGHPPEKHKRMHNGRPLKVDRPKRFAVAKATTSITGMAMTLIR